MHDCTLSLHARPAHVIAPDKSQRTPYGQQSVKQIYILQDVRCVIHYQLPASADVYVHRSGRTGRGSQDGITIALVTPKEAARYQGLQKAMDRPVPSDFPVDSTLMPAVSTYPEYSAL